MSTTFKIGDRVRHIHSVPAPREIVAVGSNTVCVRGAREWDPSLEIWIKDKIALVEEAEPRKRLREYTDLCDGDVVVIAGVPFMVDGDALIAGEQYIWTTQMPWAAMLVDEVRRKPRTKKRFVVEECEEHTGVMVHGVQVKVVEETEVPR